MLSDCILLIYEFPKNKFKMISYTSRTIVNGALLRNHLNQHVSIHVNVEPKAERQATIIHGKTTDDLDVQVHLNEPLNTPLNGWIEVIGIPNGPTSIRNKEVWILFSHIFYEKKHSFQSIVKYFQIIIFPGEEGDEPFDKTAHNALVTFLNNCTDIFDQPTDMF